MIKALIYSILLLSSFSACDVKQDKHKNTAKVAEAPLATIRKKKIPNMWDLGMKDTTVTVWLDSSIFLEYKYKGDSSYTIRWGNKGFVNTSSTEYMVSGNGVLYVEDFDNQSIILRQGCGTECWYSLVLPIDSGRVENYYYYLLAYDLENQKIAYLQREDSLAIENYKTGEIRTYSTSDWGKTTIKVQAFDSAYFTPKSFVIYYRGELRKDWVHSDRIKKEITLDF